MRTLSCIWTFWKIIDMLPWVIGTIIWFLAKICHSQVSCNDAYECVNRTINATNHVYFVGYRSGASKNTKVSITSGGGIDTQMTGALGGYKMGQIISPDLIAYTERSAAYIVNEPYGIIAETYIDCHGALSCVGSTIYLETGSLVCRTVEACARTQLTVTSLIEARGTYSLANAIIRPAQDDLIIKWYAHLAGYNATVICNSSDHICDLECYGNACFNVKFICHTNAACSFDCDDSISRICPTVYVINDTWTENGM